jgi:antitoxin component YwqK of YwqJK toxin-antitoxin module
MRLLTLICLVLLSSCSQEPEVVTGHILVRDGITYHQDTNEPITGIVEEFYENGQLKVRQYYKDGKGDGLHEGFYTNGQLEFRQTYKDGKVDGWWESYHINGQVRGSGSVIEGNQDGVYVWFDNGVPFMTRLYKNGVEVK